MRRALWLLVALSAVLSLSAVAAGAQDAGELEDVKSRLNQIANEIEEAEAAAEDADAELANATERLAEVEAIVNDLAVQLEQQEARVAAAQDELDALQAKADAVQAAFDARTVEMFKYSYGSDIDAVLSAGDIQEAIDRRTLLDQVNESDRATVERVQATRGAVLTQREVLEQEEERLQTLKAEQEEVLEQVRRIRQSKALAAAEAEARVDQLNHEHEDLEAEREEIEELIAARQAPPPSIAPPSSASSAPRSSSVSASGYIWPSCGTVTSEYGRRWGRMHEGLDIDDDRGGAIVAPKAGTVIFAGWQGGYGNATMIDHGDGVVTLYAHQSSIAVGKGEVVSQGQSIGVIGTTGNSTGTHLHFETRVGGYAQNPRNYLSGGC